MLVFRFWPAAFVSISLTLGCLWPDTRADWRATTAVRPNAPPPFGMEEFFKDVPHQRGVQRVCGLAAAQSCKDSGVTGRFARGKMLARDANPALNQVCVRRGADFSSESAKQLKAADTRQRGKLRKRYRRLWGGIKTTDCFRNGW